MYAKMRAELEKAILEPSTSDFLNNNVDTYRDDLHQQLADEKEKNALLNASIKAKDYEIASLRRIFERFEVDAVYNRGYNQEDLRDIVEVQEKIESVLREEIVRLKKVIRVQKTIIETKDPQRSQLLIDPFSQLDYSSKNSPNNSPTENTGRSRNQPKNLDRSRSLPKTRSNGFASDKSVRSSFTMLETESLSTREKRSRSSKSRSPWKHYENATVSSVLHSPTIQKYLGKGKEKSKAAREVEREAALILKELSTKRYR